MTANICLLLAALSGVCSPVWDLKRDGAGKSAPFEIPAKAIRDYGSFVAEATVKFGEVKPGENPFRADDHTAYAVRKDCGSGVGLKLGWMTPDSLDLGGKPRLAKDGTVDFGCYQFWRKPGLLLFVW